jgi:HK97 family phage major capsid protein
MLAQALAHALDRAVLFGSGADNEPTGIFNTAGINTVSMGTNGAAVTNYTQILQALKLIAAANFDKSKAVAALHPNVAYSYESLTNSLGNAMRKPDALNNFQMLESTAVPVNQTQGTANGTASSIIVGQFDQCLLGTRQQITIEVSRSGYDGSGDVFLKNGVLIRCVGRFDVQLAQPKAFTAITGVL